MFLGNRCVAAAASARRQLEHLAPPEDPGKPRRGKATPPDVNLVRRLLRQALEARAEPEEYPSLHAAVLLELAAKNRLIFNDEAVGNIRKLVHTALESDEFTDLEGRVHPETGRWALSKWQKMF